MIDIKNNRADTNLISLISKNSEFGLNEDADISDEEADKALYLISKNSNEVCTSESSSPIPKDCQSYELGSENKNIGKCTDTCSSYDNGDFFEKDGESMHNELTYQSEETEDSESDSEISTEDENSSDENYPDTVNNSIMQERWKELDKYGSTSHISPNHANQDNIYRVSAPINLTSNSSLLSHQLSDNIPSINNYCMGNSALHGDPFMLGINSHSSNDALNMSIRHMASMKPIKNLHMQLMENNPHYHVIPQKSYKSDLIHCRLPNQNPNVHSSVNYDYVKDPRLSLNQFSVNDMRSQFHFNMMMSGIDQDSLPMQSMSHHPHLQDFRCNYCNKCYTNQSSLRSHLKKHMNIEEKKYKCDKCSYSSQYQKNLLKHIHINHEELNDTKQCRCEICDRIFSSEFLLKDHLRMHTNDNTYQCHQCGKKLKTKLKLRYHADVHNPEKPYICDIDNCDRAFRTPKYLKNHKDEFHKLQPKKHFCPVENCKLVFQRKSHLKRHMSMHDGEKNYHCNWPDCNRSFRSQETLNVHLIRHTGEKPFKCELCDYSCRQKASLNYHCRNAHAKDCERLLGLKPFSNDGRPQGPRPVGRPPRNRLGQNSMDNFMSSKFDSSEDSEVQFGSKIEKDVNEIVCRLNNDPNIGDVFKKPAPVDENDPLRKEVFILVDDVIRNPAKNYDGVEDFSLEELCMIELSIKSKRGRKRKVLKELDALLAQRLHKGHNFFEEEEEDENSNDIIDQDEDARSRSPICISKSQYTPSILQCQLDTSNNGECFSQKSNLGPLSYDNISSDRLGLGLSNELLQPTNGHQKIHSIENNSPVKMIADFVSPVSSFVHYSNHSTGVPSFNASYILANNSKSFTVDNQSSSHSNTPISGQIKTDLDDIECFDEINDNSDDQIDSPDYQLSIKPANLTISKPKNTSQQIDTEMKVFEESDIVKIEKVQQHIEKPRSFLDSVDNLKMNKDLLNQVLDDLKVIKNDENQRPKPFLSPPFAAQFSNVSNVSTNTNDMTDTTDNGSKTVQDTNTSSSALKLTAIENKNQPKSLDSSLCSDSGYSSGHDNTGINKENSGVTTISTINLTVSVPSISDAVNCKITSPLSTTAAAAFFEKTAVAAEIAAISASAAILNSELYASYQNNIGNNITFGDSSGCSQYEGIGFNSDLTSMSNICSSMYKSGIEDHLRSLTALGSKYMDTSGYQGSNRAESIPVTEMSSVDTFNHLWSNASVSAGDYLSISHNGSTGGPSLNPFDSTIIRNGIEDYCNLAQSQSVAAAADFYSQMTASANYDKYPSLYGCRDNFYDNSVNSNRGISAQHNDSNDYVERNCLSPARSFYHQSVSNQYGNRYHPSGASAADYISMGRQFASSGSSGNPFSVASDPYRNYMLNNMSPFNRYPL